MAQTTDDPRPHPARRDPVLLVAWTTLGVLGAAALTFTAVDRTPSRAGTTDPSSRVVARPAETARPAPASPDPGASGAIGGPSTAPPIGPQTTVAVNCPASGVAIRADAGDHAMGLRTMSLRLLNCGKQAYTVTGYPVLQVLAADESPLAVEVINGPSDITVAPAVDEPALEVTLQPGESAGSTLVWRRSMLDSAGGGAYLRAAPHGGQPSQTVVVPHRMDLGNNGRLGVGPWRRP